MNDYCTQSTNIVAWLMSKKIMPKQKIKGENNMTIIYERSKELSECLDQYHNNKELKEFISAFKQARKFISE